MLDQVVLKRIYWGRRFESEQLEQLSRHYLPLLLSGIVKQLLLRS
jgi:hypothetical protein